MGCGVVERHLEMAQPTKKNFMAIVGCLGIGYFHWLLSKGFILDTSWLLVEVRVHEHW